MDQGIAGTRTSGVSPVWARCEPGVSPVWAEWILCRVQVGSGRTQRRASPLSRKFTAKRQSLELPRNIQKSSKIYFQGTLQSNCSTCSTSSDQKIDIFDIIWNPFRQIAAAVATPAGPIQLRAQQYYTKQTYAVLQVSTTQNGKLIWKRN